MPQINWEKNYKLPEGVPKDELLNLEPENLNVKDDTMLRDKINQWIENTLYYVILRKKYDRIDKDKNLLYLFRLLAIKYRINYPATGDHFEVDGDIAIILETKIVNAAVAFFEEGRGKGKVIYVNYPYFGIY